MEALTSSSFAKLSFSEDGRSILWIRNVTYPTNRYCVSRLKRYLANHTETLQINCFRPHWLNTWRTQHLDDISLRRRTNSLSSSFPLLILPPLHLRSSKNSFSPNLAALQANICWRISPKRGPAKFNTDQSNNNTQASKDARTLLFELQLYAMHAWIWGTAGRGRSALRHCVRINE